MITLVSPVPVMGVSQPADQCIQSDDICLTQDGDGMEGSLASPSAYSQSHQRPTYAQLLRLAKPLHITFIVRSPRFHFELRTIRRLSGVVVYGTPKLHNCTIFGGVGHLSALT